MEEGHIFAYKYMNALILNIDYSPPSLLFYFIFVRIIYIMLTIHARLYCANKFVRVDKLDKLVLLNFDFLTRYIMSPIEKRLILNLSFSISKIDAI